VKPNIRLSTLWVLACATVVILVAGSTLATAASKTRQFVPGEKAKISGQIISRDGDLVRLREKKSENLVVIRINDDTTIERQKHKFPFYRHSDMDATALLPGLTIEAEGAGTPTGELDARKISFTPDDFAVEVAEEQQVVTNKASAQNAQSTADRAAASADQAQT
jgi:hypothetical protein